MVELLAPAKNLECGIAAINYGADAVYIGGPDFSARSQASNSIADIRRLVLHAHQYWAKVYVALNTLLTDNEISIAGKLIRELYEAEIDALIIQDIGLLESDLPPIPLFASSQMTNMTTEKVQFLQKAGFKRVILERALSLEEIKEIRRKTTVDLECFVHGSLCVAYGGFCNLSYIQGKRSANKGNCAQPCRKRYDLYDENGLVLGSKNFLSLKDLNLSESLEQLMDAGISSFKVEGRLKDVNYIKNIIYYYRKKIDKLKSATKVSSGFFYERPSKLSFEVNPEKTFNRGYTSYFFKTRQKMASLDSPKSLGEEIGKITGITQRYIELNKSAELNPGDGICFFDRENKLVGTYINKVENNKVFLDKHLDRAKRGILIYRNFDKQFNQWLKRDPIQRKIKIHFLCFQTKNDYSISVFDEDGISVTRCIARKEQGNSTAGDLKERFKRGLQKCGGTLFYCVNVKVDSPELPDLSLSEINLIRRQLLDLLGKERIKFFQRVINYPETEQNFSLKFDINRAENVSNEKAELYYKRHGVEKTYKAIENLTEQDERSLMTTKYCIKYELDLCPKKSKIKQNSKNFYIRDEKGRDFLLSFDCDKCEMQVRQKS
ncbi:MAG: U32 family peptidase [Candidatus Margulisbacteria bacterium]|nr:U32 family peptidase [Candidatus Margulisiibacteriota bacterium]